MKDNGDNDDRRNLGFDFIRGSRHYAVPEPLQRAIGVSKSFTKTPRFRAGRGRDAR